MGDSVTEMRSRLGQRMPVVVSLAGALAAVLALAAAAAAAIPLAGAQYTGPSAHHSYVLTLSPYCSTAGCKNPPLLSITLTTPGKGRCPSGNWTFGLNGAGTPLKDGAFSASGYFSQTLPQRKFTVTGSFSSSRTVHGNVIRETSAAPPSLSASACRPSPVPPRARARC